MDGQVVDIVANFGGLGLLGIFAWVLLRSTLSMTQRLGDLLENHLTTLLDQSREFLEEIKALRREVRAHRRACPADKCPADDSD